MGILGFRISATGHGEGESVACVVTPVVGLLEPGLGEEGRGGGCGGGG